MTATTTETDTSPFAVLDEGCAHIVETRDLTDAERDRLAREYGRRLVYLPMGGEPGDRVTVDEDGEAEVVTFLVGDRIEAREPAEGPAASTGTVYRVDGQYVEVDWDDDARTTVLASDVAVTGTEGD